MANTQIHNLLTEINALLQRPPQMANGADQVLASEEWQYREQLKQLRSRLEGMTDDSQINDLEQKFRALVHQLQPLQVPTDLTSALDRPTDGSSSPSVMPLPPMPPLPPLKGRDQREISRPMPLPPLGPVGGNTAPSRVPSDPMTGERDHPVKATPRVADNLESKSDDALALSQSRSDQSRPEKLTLEQPASALSDAVTGASTTDSSQPLPLPPHLKFPVNVPVASSNPDPSFPTNTVDPSNAPESDVAENDAVVMGVGSDGLRPLFSTPIVNAANNIAPETELPMAAPLEITSEEKSTTKIESHILEPQLLTLLEQVVQKTVQQAVQQSLDTERAVILNEISQTIAQNIAPHPEANPHPANNLYYERLEEEIANLKLQKELLNQEISRLASAQESWSSQVASIQSQQKEELQESLQAVVQEAVQSAVQDTLEQTIEQALQNKSNTVFKNQLGHEPTGTVDYAEPSSFSKPNPELTPIAPELVSQVQQQTDRFLLNLDAMFNATFQNLEHDLEGYKAAFEKKLSYIEQLEHRGEALLDSIISKADISKAEQGDSRNTHGLRETQQSSNSGYRENIELPPEIDPSYLPPAQEYVDESLIERLLSSHTQNQQLDNEPLDIHNIDHGEEQGEGLNSHNLDHSPIAPEASKVPNQIIDGNWMVFNDDAGDPSAPTELASVPDEMELNQEVNTIEDLLTLFPEDELFASTNASYADSFNAVANPSDLEQWQEIYADDVTIAADMTNYQFGDMLEDLHGNPIPNLHNPEQPEIDLERDVLSHLSDLAQMLEEVENTSTVVPMGAQNFDLNAIPDDLTPADFDAVILPENQENHVGHDHLTEDLLALINSESEDADQETMVATGSGLMTPDALSAADDVTLIALPMMHLPPLPPMPKSSVNRIGSEADHLEKLEIPSTGNTSPPSIIEAPSGMVEPQVTELKIPNLTEVTADDDLLSWLNDNPLSEPSLSEPSLSESVTIAEQPQNTSVSKLQPLPLPVLPSISETVMQMMTGAVTEGKDIANIANTNTDPNIDPLKKYSETKQLNNQENTKNVDSSTSEAVASELFDIENLGTDDESLILLPNSKGAERQEVIPWDDSLIRQLAEDLNSLGEGGGANPLVATNIDQVIRNTPFRHTQPATNSAQTTPAPENLPSPPIARQPEPPSAIAESLILPLADQDDPDQLFAAVIAEQIASRSLSDDTTEAVDELDALLSGKTTSISSSIPSSNFGGSSLTSSFQSSESDVTDGSISPFDGDISQLFQNLETDREDLLPHGSSNSGASSTEGIEALDRDHGVIFHDLTADLNDLSQELSGNPRHVHNIENLLDSLDDELTYIITDDASTVLEPVAHQTKLQENQDQTLQAETGLALEPEERLSEADNLNFDDVISALDDIERLDNVRQNIRQPDAIDSKDAHSDLAAHDSVAEEDSWQRELDELANLTPVTPSTNYHQSISESVAEEEPLSSADFFASLERESAAEAAAKKLVEAGATAEVK